MNICTITSFDECMGFVYEFNGDDQFSDPMLSNEEQLKNNLSKAIRHKENHCVIGVFQHELMVGLFSFLVLPDEQYMEMIIGLSRDRDAYEMIFQHLKQHYAGYKADFVFNPQNALLREQLISQGAEFEPEQKKMVLHKSVTDVDTTGVELFSERYAQQYFAVHNQDVYWTGEKVTAAPDRFRTFLAIHENKVVGYLDVTHCFEENEPYDLFVLEDYRRKGYGRKLLAMAVEMNQPNAMMLLVDVDNYPAIRLYESMGFVRVEGQNSLTAHWKIPG